VVSRLLCTKGSGAKGSSQSRSVKHQEPKVALNLNNKVTLYTQNKK
jgi:hypothetical protein